MHFASSAMHLALVVNPTSGKRRGESVAAKAAQRLGRAGHTTTLIHVENARAARDQLTQAIEVGLDGVVVVGGDGALHAVLDHVADTDLILGLIPVGTGNDTARSLGIPTRDVDAAIDLVIAGWVCRIDLARADEAYVATVVTSGFDSKVNERNIAIVNQLRALSPREFTLTLDGRTIEREAMLVAVGNGSFGGGLRICKSAFINDGLLDVVVINPVSKVKLLRSFPELYGGSHVRLPEFERHLVREVTLSSPGVVAYGDGERLGPLPMTTAIQPGALRVFSPLPTPHGAAAPFDSARSLNT